MVPAMIYLIGMPIKLIPGTSLFVTVFISAIVTVLHAFNYGSIDLILVIILIVGSIIGVQVGQKVGQYLDSSHLKTLFAMLLCCVAIAIAYDTFFTKVVRQIKQTEIVNLENINPFSKFIINALRSKSFTIRFTRNNNCYSFRNYRRNIKTIIK